MFRSRVLPEIQSLDPVRDHERIVFLSTRFDFPFDTTRALELALFRTFGVPSISALLDRTGEFQERTQKRYDDTDIIVSEMLEWGYTSARGQRALKRMNQLHGRFQIANQDFLYVLSTFIYEPIRWNQRFGWRPLCENERLAYFHFWRAVGHRMGIRDIPADYDAYAQFSQEYEQRHYTFAAPNQRVGAATRDMFATWFPRPLAPLVRSAIGALLDDSMLSAFGFPRPSAGMRWLVPAALKTRAVFLRFLPRRRTPCLRSEMAHRTYPHGHQIESLGPPEASAGSNSLQASTIKSVI